MQTSMRKIQNLFPCRKINKRYNNPLKRQIAYSFRILKNFIVIFKIAEKFTEYEMLEVN